MPAGRDSGVVAGSEPERSASSRPHGFFAGIARTHPGTLLFAGAVLTSATILLYYLSKLTFWRDEWGFLLHRRGSGADVIFQPFVEQLLAIPVVIYKVFLTTFGMESPFPFQLTATLLFLLSVVLLFIYVRRRVGEWLALAAALPLLFFGQSWDDLLFPFQMSFFGSMSCGIGALLALDREDRTGDWLATALLSASLFFSDLGIPFVAGTALEIALGRDRFRRAYIVAIPTALWALWYLGWGHTASNFISFENFATLTGFVPDGFGSSLSSLLGLGAPRNDLGLSVLEGEPLNWGRPLLVGAVGLGVWRLLRMSAIPRRFWSVLAIATVFWSLIGLNSVFFGQAADVGRYQYLGAIFLLLVAAELARGMRASRPVVVIVLVVGVAAALSNFNTLKDAARGLEGIAQQQRAGLAALELTRGRVDPSFQLTEANSGVDYIGLLDAGSYFSAVDAYGSPAYSRAELTGSPETARIAADKVFASALAIGLAPLTGDRPSRCSTVKPNPAAVAAPLPRGRWLLQARGGDVEVMLGRYSSGEFPVDLGPLSPGASALLEIPADGSNRIWKLKLTGAGSVLLCRASGG